VTIDAALRDLAPTVLAVLLRRYGDFETCEDAVQEALLAAASQWPADGMPDNPAGWLVTVASRRNHPERVIAAAEAAGLALLGRQTSPQSVRTAPNELAQRLENRMWSWTWNIDATTWATDVEPVIAALRALPEPEAPRETIHDRALRAFGWSPHDDRRSEVRGCAARRPERGGPPESRGRARRWRRRRARRPGRRAGRSRAW
jgi:DNA-directed RNA polymerase specialized sigma24 family protein